MIATRHSNGRTDYQFSDRLTAEHENTPVRRNSIAPRGKTAHNDNYRTFLQLTATEASELTLAVREAGGFSFSLTTRKAPGGGYVTATSKTTERVVPANALCPSTILAYAEEHSAQLAWADNYLGAWVDGGQVYLDVSTRFDSLAKALGAARKAGQLSVYDVVRGQCIAVQPDRFSRLLELTSVEAAECERVLGDSVTGSVTVRQAPVFAPILHGRKYFSTYVNLRRDGDMLHVSRNKVKGD